MHVKKKTVVLGIFADRIDVVACGRDQTTAARRVQVDLNAEAAAWSRTMKEIAPQVRAAVEELGASESPALVLYRNPTAFADYASLAMKSGTQAREAAMLGCAESLSYPLDAATTAALVLGRDSAGAHPQTHVVVAADQDEVATDIAEFVDAAGLTFETAVPIDAALMAHIGSAALQGKSANKGLLYVGEHRSFFIISDRGAILFARKIDLGVDALIWSLTRPLRATGHQAPIELPYNDAKMILHRFGFPQRDQIVHSAPQLTGAQLIPLLQPALQRFIVELRQSLRFGVQEEQRQGMELVVTGPGSAVPNFTSLIANELRIPVASDAAYASFDCQNPLTAGSEINDALANRTATTRLGLQPALVSKSRNFNRVRRWFLTGASAAIAIVGFDALSFHKRLASARERVQSVASQASDIQAMQSTADKLFKVIGAVDGLEALIAAETGATIDLRACLQELSRVTPQSIRLVSVTFTTEKGERKARLAGCASDAKSSGPRTQLEPFVEGLKASPLFQEVVLSNVQIAPSGQAAGQQFEITLVAVAVPRGGSTSSLASAEGGAKP
jgi:Tfp pilus assembly PilM family ATPase